LPIRVGVYIGRNDFTVVVDRYGAVRVGRTAHVKRIPADHQPLIRFGEHRRFRGGHGHLNIFQEDFSHVCIRVVVNGPDGNIITTVVNVSDIPIKGIISGIVIINVFQLAVHIEFNGLHAGQGVNGAKGQRPRFREGIPGLYFYVVKADIGNNRAFGVRHFKLPRIVIDSRAITVII